MQVRKLIRGTAPLLISIPHMGTYLPPDIKARMTANGQRVPDTDWHLDLLYDFAVEMGASVLMSTHSRYVIDLNRPQEDEDLYPGQVKTGLCPLQSFDGKDIYRQGEEPDAFEKTNRIGAYWLPYHEMIGMELRRMRDEFGHAVLYDAHSIKSELPRLFDGVLQDLNVGTARGQSASAEVEKTVMSAIDGRGYATVLNGRFVGGHITRHYGRPQENIHAVQMEITQKNYMDEETFAYDEAKAKKLQAVLKDVIATLAKWRP